MRKKPRIGLALGSGSARGWAHIGAIRELESRGIKPDLVCGTSIGALVGAAYAGGALDALERLVLGLTRGGVLRMMDLTLKGGLMRGDRAYAVFSDILGQRDIAELALPFGAVATELESGREVWLREGSVLDAVRASAAVPGLFTPVLRDGVLLVDGGLVNPIPVSMCRELGADLVIAIDVSWGKLGVYRELHKPARAPRAGDDSWLGRLRARFGEGKPAPERTPSMLQVFNTALDIVEQRVARSRLAGEPADVLIAPLLPGFRGLEYHRGREAIDEGRKAVERMAPHLEQVIRP